MLPRPTFLLLSLFFVFVTGSVIRKDVDEVESNKGIEGIVEGDIMLTEDQSRSVEAIGKRVKRQITKRWSKWPNGIVYYYFEDSFTSLKRQLMATAIDYISSQTCVTFKESSTAVNRIKFMNDGGCASYIGMNGNEQVLWFGDGCAIFGTAVHEIMHALGIFHTHSRYDRDDYLLVNLTDVPENMLGNFDKETTQSTYNAVPFEYGSTMQYRVDSFGYDTLLPKDEVYEKTMGLRRVSFYDLVNINTHYSCGCTINLPCKNGGYTNPSICSECVCPLGYGGILCDEVPYGSIELFAESYWKGYWVTFGYNNPTLTTNFYINYMIIKAPADKTIQVRIVELSNFTCDYGCNYNGVEIKYMGDPRITNPIFCCKDDKNVINHVYTSKLNPLPIVMHQRYTTSKVTINYRYLDEPLSNNKKVKNGYDCYEYYA